MYLGLSPAQTMRYFRDNEGRIVRLTDERRDHILEHPEMRDLEPAIAQTVADPQRVVQSVSDDGVRLYYQWLSDTPLGDKYLCVVVKTPANDAFVLTAYLTDTVKKGRILWPIEN